MIFEMEFPLGFRGDGETEVAFFCTFSPCGVPVGCGVPVVGPWWGWIFPVSGWGSLVPGAVPSLRPFPWVPSVLVLSRSLSFVWNLALRIINYL